MKALCSHCFKSNTEVTLSTETGLPICKDCTQSGVA